MKTEVTTNNPKRRLKQSKIKRLIHSLLLLTISTSLLGLGRTTTDYPEVQDSQLFDKKTCIPQRMRSPINLKKPMRFRDFNVQFKFQYARNVEVAKMDFSSFQLNGEDFGAVYLDGKKYTVTGGYVKAPSDHQLEGQYLHAELQVSATSGSQKLVLVKLLQEVPKIEDGYQSGLGQFGFGKHKLLRMAPKLSLDKELAFIMAGKMNQMPKSTMSVHNRVSLESFFFQDELFMMYQGQETFAECDNTIYLISYDPAAISTPQLHDFIMRPYSLFPILDAKKINTIIFNNKDVPPGYHKKKPPVIPDHKPKPRRQQPQRRRRNNRNRGRRRNSEQPPMPGGGRHRGGHIHMGPTDGDNLHQPVRTNDRNPRSYPPRNQNPYPQQQRRPYPPQEHYHYPQQQRSPSPSPGPNPYANNGGYGSTHRPPPPNVQIPSEVKDHKPAYVPPPPEKMVINPNLHSLGHIGTGLTTNHPGPTGGYNVPPPAAHHNNMVPPPPPPPPAYKKHHEAKVVSSPSHETSTPPSVVHAQPVQPTGLGKYMGSGRSSRNGYPYHSYPTQSTGYQGSRGPPSGPYQSSYRRGPSAVDMYRRYGGAINPSHYEGFYGHHESKEEKEKSDDKEEEKKNKKKKEVPKFHEIDLKKFKKSKVIICPYGSVFAWQKLKMYTIKKSGSKKNFPDLKPAEEGKKLKYKWAAIFYSPRKAGKKTVYVPNLVKVPVKYNILKRKKGEPIPIWNPKEKVFKLFKMKMGKKPKKSKNAKKGKGNKGKHGKKGKGVKEGKGKDGENKNGDKKKHKSKKGKKGKKGAQNGKNKNGKGKENKKGKKEAKDKSKGKDHKKDKKGHQKGSKKNKNKKKHKVYHHKVLKFKKKNFSKKQLKFHKHVFNLEKRGKHHGGGNGKELRLLHHKKTHSSTSHSVTHHESVVEYHKPKVAPSVALKSSGNAITNSFQALKQKMKEKLEEHMHKKQVHHEEVVVVPDGAVVEQDDTCQKLMNKAAQNPTEELREALKQMCGINLGGKLGNYVPLLGRFGSITHSFSSFFKRMAQKPQHDEASGAEGGEGEGDLGRDGEDGGDDDDDNDDDSQSALLV